MVMKNNIALINKRRSEMRMQSRKRQRYRHSKRHFNLYKRRLSEKDEIPELTENNV
jgi:hypothetical protein